MQLWHGKKTIVTCVVVAIVLAVIYIFVAKEKWTSTAIITQPDAAQVATYNGALNILYGNAAPSLSDVQSRVIGRFNASISALSQALDNQLVPEKLSIEPAVKGQALPLVITYVSSTAEGAQKQLNQYIRR
jgi:chain length determinant protein (polysaccharide antigen chain regulator)